MSSVLWLLGKKKPLYSSKRSSIFVVTNYFFCSWDASLAENPKLDIKTRRVAVAKMVVAAVMDIWNLKSRPIRSEKAIKGLVSRLFDRIEYVRKGKRHHETDAVWIQEIVEEHGKIFDISAKAVNDNLDEPVPMEIDEPVAVELDLGKRKRRAPVRFEVTLISFS